MAGNKREDEASTENQHHKGVKHLCENATLTRVPNKYVLPVPERHHHIRRHQNASHIQLPTIDFAQLLGPERQEVLETLAKACEEYGVFQVTNHCIPIDIERNMIDVSKRFFELPHDERAMYMNPDLNAPVRCGTSFNQNQDGVFCWRDFLKLSCDPMSDIHWPSSPYDFRHWASAYSKHTKYLFETLMKAILESLGLVEDENVDHVLKQFQDGSQLMFINFFPSCPEPEHSLGMPPHSDYGSLTLILQDEVDGEGVGQIHHQGEWFTVEPLPESITVRVGDHLEILSNGRYKSVLHRVLVNSTMSHMSVASYHSVPFETIVRPLPELIDESNPKRYKDTDFDAFLNYISSCDSKEKNFLESRKCTSIEEE